MMQMRSPRPPVDERAHRAADVMIMLLELTAAIAGLFLLWLILIAH